MSRAAWRDVDGVGEWSVRAAPQVHATFGVDAAADIGDYPTDTVFQEALGGGAVTLLGPYLVQVRRGRASRPSPPRVCPSLLLAPTPNLHDPPRRPCVSCAK